MYRTKNVANEIRISDLENKIGRLEVLKNEPERDYKNEVDPLEFVSDEIGVSTGEAGGGDSRTWFHFSDVRFMGNNEEASGSFKVLDTNAFVDHSIYSQPNNMASKLLNVITKMECIDCKATFKDGDSLRGHWAVCTFRWNCRKKKTVKFDLSNDHFTKHNVNQSFQCKKADFGRELAEKSTLNDHKEVHIDKWQFQKKNMGTRGDRSFKCQEPGCGNTFFRKSNLSNHMRRHTGKRLFYCQEPDCMQKFTQKTKLMCHMRMHAGKMEIKCDEPDCGKIFAGVPNIGNAAIAK